MDAMPAPFLGDRGTFPIDTERRPRTWAWSTPLGACLTIVVVWRLALALVGIAAPLFHLPGHPAFSLLRAEHWPTNPLTQALSSSVQNDSVWYGLTTMRGYSAPWMVNFSPLFPFLIKVVSLVTGDVWIAGLLVANASLVLAVYLLREWMALRGQARYAPPATVILLLNPGAIFFGYMYAESVYLALLLGTLVAYEKNRYAVAAACAGLLTITRPTGFLVLVILGLWFLQRRTWRAALPIVGCVAGIAAYALFQWIAYGSPLEQYQQEGHFGVPRTFAQGVADLTLHPTPGHPLSALILLLATLLLYLAAVRLVHRYYGTAYAALAAALLVFPALTGLASYQRYAAVAFMVPAAVAVWGNRRVIFAWLTWSLWFTIAAAALFTSGLVF